MTDAHEQHLQQIKDKFVSEVDKKYRAGVKEHGGNLAVDYTLPELLDMAMEEVLDLWVYLESLRMRLQNELEEKSSPSNTLSLQQCVARVQKAIKEQGL